MKISDRLMSITAAIIMTFLLGLILLVGGAAALCVSYVRGGFYGMSIAYGMICELGEMLQTVIYKIAQGKFDEASAYMDDHMPDGE